MADLPNRIWEIRKQRGLTQVKLADLVGCSHVQISELERGDITLTLQWMQRIARALDVLPGDLLLAKENSDSLSPDERALVDLYRMASPDQRAQLARMADVIVPFRHAEPDEATQKKAGGRKPRAA